MNLKLLIIFVSFEISGIFFSSNAIVGTISCAILERGPTQTNTQPWLSVRILL